MAGPRSGLHPLERQAAMLGSAMKDRVSALSSAITPKGGRPPFTEKKSNAETLAWWLQHRYDQYGLAVIQTLTPMQIAELDAWLTEAVNHPAMQAAAGMPQRPQAQIPGVQSVLTHATAQELKMQGPAIGPAFESS